MPTKNVSPSVKLVVLRREVGIGVEQAEDGRLSKRSILDIAESLLNELQSDLLSGDIRRPAGVLGVTYIAPDFDEPSPLISELFEGRD